MAVNYIRKKEEEKKEAKGKQCHIYYMFDTENSGTHYFWRPFLIAMIITDTVLCVFFYVSCLEFSTSGQCHGFSIDAPNLSLSHSLKLYIAVIIYVLFLFCHCDKCEIKWSVFHLYLFIFMPIIHELCTIYAYYSVLCSFISLIKILLTHLTPL